MHRLGLNAAGAAAAGAAGATVAETPAEAALAPGKSVLGGDDARDPAAAAVGRGDQPRLFSHRINASPRGHPPAWCDATAVSSNRRCGGHRALRNILFYLA